MASMPRKKEAKVVIREVTGPPFPSTRPVMVMAQLKRTPLAATGLPASELWRRLLEGRLQQLGPTLPRTLQGTLQIEVAGEKPRFFHLILGGPKGAQAREGVAARPDVWIETTEAELSRLLAGASPEGALRTLGKVELASGMFAAMSKQSMAMSQIALRSRN